MSYQGVSNCHYSWDRISVDFLSSSASLQRSGTPQCTIVAMLWPALLLEWGLLGPLRGLESVGWERLSVSQRQRGR